MISRILEQLSHLDLHFTTLPSPLISYIQRRFVHKEPINTPSDHQHLLNKDKGGGRNQEREREERLTDTVLATVCATPNSYAAKHRLRGWYCV